MSVRRNIEGGCNYKFTPKEGTPLHQKGPKQNQNKPIETTFAFFHFELFLLFKFF